MNECAEYDGPCPRCGERMTGIVRPLPAISPFAPKESAYIPTTQVWDSLECESCGQWIVPSRAPLTGDREPDQ